MWKKRKDNSSKRWRIKSNWTARKMIIEIIDYEKFLLLLVWGMLFRKNAFNVVLVYDRGSQHIFQTSLYTRNDWKRVCEKVFQNVYEKICRAPRRHSNTTFFLFLQIYNTQRYWNVLLKSWISLKLTIRKKILKTSSEPISDFKKNQISNL